MSLAVAMRREARNPQYHVRNCMPIRFEIVRMRAAAFEIPGFLDGLASAVVEDEI